MTLRARAVSDPTTEVDLTGQYVPTTENIQTLGLPYGEPIQIVQVSDDTVTLVATPAQMVAPSLVPTTDSIEVTSADDPDDRGAAITGYEVRYSTDDATWSAPVTVSSLPYTITGLTSPGTFFYVQIAARNSVGLGAWSPSSSATLLSAATSPSNFDVGSWDVGDAGTGGDAVLEIVSLPSDGGSPITDIEYRIGGGSWASLGQISVGSYSLTGLFTDGVATTVELRARNSVGPGPESDIKEITSTLAVVFSAEDNQAVLRSAVPVPLTIAAPGRYAGSFTYDPAQVTNGVQILSAPIIENEAPVVAGSLLVARPALFVHDDEPVLTTHQWYKGSQPIAGVTDHDIQTTADGGDDGGVFFFRANIQVGENDVVVIDSPSVTLQAAPSGVAIAEDFASFSANDDITTSVDWTQPRGSTPIIVNSNGHAQPNVSVGAASQQLHVLHSDTPTDAQFAEILWEQAPAAVNNEAGVVLRWQSDGPASFILVFFNGNNNIKVQSFNNGSFTNNLSIGGYGQPSPGDTLRVEITDDDQLTILKNGAQFNTVQDLSGDVPAGGQVGMYVNILAGNTALPIFRQFNGGDL